MIGEIGESVTEAIEAIQALLKDNWNTSNYAPRSFTSGAVVKDGFIRPIWERGAKAMQIARTDFISLYQIIETYETPTISRRRRDRESRLSIDIRTNTRDRLISIVTEVERILNSNNVSPGSGWDYLTLLERREKSDRTKSIFWMVIDVRINIIGESI